MPNDCKINCICIALMLNPYKFNGICTDVMPNDCKSEGICIAVMPHDWKIHSICIALKLNPCICNAIALSACSLGGAGWWGAHAWGRRSEGTFQNKTDVARDTSRARPCARSAQGSGCPGRQGGIVDKIPIAGSPWLLTE